MWSTVFRECVCGEGWGGLEAVGVVNRSGHQFAVFSAPESAGGQWGRAVALGERDAGQAGRLPAAGGRQTHAARVRLTWG